MIQLTLNLKSKKPSTVYALNGKTYRLKPGSNVLNLEYNDYVALAKALSISPIMEDPANVKKHKDPVKQPVPSTNKSEESDKVDELDNSVEEIDKDADDRHDDVEDTSAVDNNSSSEDSDNTEEVSHEDAVDEPVNDNMEDSVEDSNDNDSADNDELEEPHDTAEVHNEPETEDQIEDTADDSSVENEDQHEESATEDVTTEAVNELVNEDKESVAEDLPTTDDDNVEDKQLSEMVDYSTWSYNDLKAEYKNVTGKSCKLKKAEIIAFLQEHSSNAE